MGLGVRMRRLTVMLMRREREAAARRLGSVPGGLLGRRNAVTMSSLRLRSRHPMLLLGFAL